MVMIFEMIQSYVVARAIHNSTGILDISVAIEAQLRGLGVGSIHGSMIELPWHRASAQHRVLHVKSRTT